MAGVVLGIGRAIGETMAVIMVAGNQAWSAAGTVERSPHDDDEHRSWKWAMRPDLHREALIATGVVLFVFILIINLCVCCSETQGRERVGRSTKWMKTKKYTDNRFGRWLQKCKNHPFSGLAEALVWLSGIMTMAIMIYLVAFIVIHGVPHLKPSLFALVLITRTMYSLMPALVNTLIMTALFPR